MTLRKWLLVWHGRVLYLRVGLLSGTVPQRVLIPLLLSDVAYGLQCGIKCIASHRTFTLPLNNELWWTVWVKTSVVLYSASPVCNKFKFHCTSLSCKKYYVLYSLGSPSCELLFVSIPVSVALIETLLEELSCSAVFWSELPSNDDYHTQPSIFWVALPQYTILFSSQQRRK